MPDGTDLSFKVHPAAEAFAMLPEDELQALADNIKANGLFHPIVLSPDGTQLVDGRNRLAACAIAGVEPRFDRLPKNVDPRDYIISANVTRRDLTKGQKALAVALIWPAPDKRGRGNKSEATKYAESAGFSARLLQDARQIVRHEDLVDMVKSGSMKFDFALTQATERETVQRNVVTYMAQLQAEAPDIARMVREEQLNLQEAWAAFQQRKTDEIMAERERCESYQRIVERITRGLTDCDNEGFEAGLRERLTGNPGFKSGMLERQQIDIAKMERGFDKLKQILREICP
jgi:hypothetical protein